MSEPQHSATPHEGTTRPNSAVSLDFVSSATVCYALQFAGIPLIQELTVTNLGAQALSRAEVVVSLSLGLGAEQRFPLPPVPPGDKVALPVVDLRFEPERLRAMTEREPAQLLVKIRQGSEVLASAARETAVLAFNEWPGLGAPTELLATFVTPNEPCVAPVLVAVAQHLERSTRDGSILAYQAGSLGRARAEATALYECVRGLGIRYVGVPPSFEETGQKVRLAEVVLSEKLANCLDISLLFAGLFEAMGFAPIIVLMRAHAFCGLWLDDDRFPEGVVEDSARIRTLLGLGSLLLFDPTAMLSGSTFTEAQAVGARQLEAGEEFVAALDIRVLRRARYLPLPIRSDRYANSAASDRVIEAAPLGEAAQTAAHGKPSPRSNERAVRTPAEARFRKWKESLLDLSLRNRLLNFRLATKSALRLEVPDPALFEDLLAADRSFQLLPRPHQDGARSPRILAGREEEIAEVRKAYAADLAKAVIYSQEPEAELWERAVLLDRAARRDLEEGGAGTLFATIGLLRWYESPASDEPRLSPLFLYPVRLDLDRQKRRLRLRRHPDDPMPNQTLIEKMRLEFDVDLTGLTALATDDSGISVEALLRVAREAVQQMPRWEVIPEVHLGLFTFSKFLMWKDLNDNTELLLQNSVVRMIAEKGAGAAQSLAARGDLDATVPPAELPCVLDVDGTQLRAVVAALEGESFVLQGPPGTGKSQTITTLIAAAMARGKTVLFVSEKMAALEVVHRRLRETGLSDFCLELHSHKTNKKDVLASFKAVLDRPAGITASEWDGSCAGLASLRGELNSYVRALHAARPLGMSYYRAIARLFELRTQPDLHLRLNRVGECTSALFHSLKEAIERFARVAARVTPVDGHPWRASNRTSLEAAEEQALEALLGQGLGALGQLEQACQYLCQRLALATDGSWDEIDRVAQHTDALIHGIRALHHPLQSGPVARAVHEPAAWAALAPPARAYASKRSELQAGNQALLGRWNEQFLGRDATELSPRFERWAESAFGWFFLRGVRRSLRGSARGPLPTSLQVRNDLRALAQLAELRREVLSLEGYVAVGMSDVWASAASSPEGVLQLLDRSERFREAWLAIQHLPGAARLPIADSNTWPSLVEELEQQVTRLRAAQSEVRRFELTFRQTLALASEFWPEGSVPQARATVLGWLKYWAGQVADLRPWCQYQASVAELNSAGLLPVVEAHRQGLPAETLSSSFEASFLRRWSTAQLDTSPILREFVGSAHHDRVARFATSDHHHQHLSRARVLEILERKLPRQDTVIKNSELDTLLRECQKKARHQPVRRLLAAIPDLRARLKPCLLMSPLSVAQYLPPDASFDLVVFDEASQIETHDAIGAIARGRQVVVVGDSKQLPPTRFFQRARATEGSPTDENDVEDLESILDEALAKGLPEHTLGWHYRSRHDSLIEFSNGRYYQDRLQIFPAARRYVENLGVTWHPIPPGTYRAGDGPDGRTNPTEARAIVDYLVGALQRHSHSERTFGVVTFSMSQMKLIEDLLDRAREQNPDIEPHFEGSEHVFVKNLENVQGDERDEILFSICYGPDASAGRGGVRALRHHFGPLSQAGGERRLNVAITRARKQLRVFSSMGHSDIDLRRTTAQGAHDLRRFLEFAANRGGARNAHESKPRIFDSPIEREIAEELTRAGYVVHTKIGTGRYQLDMAVVHAKDERVYALAVESDGPTYGAEAVARDRDRLRGAVLRGMLWNTHRIWSLDWLRDRESEVRRLLAAAADASASEESLADDDPVKPAVAVTPEPSPLEEEPAATPSPPPPKQPRSRSYDNERDYPTVLLQRVATDVEELYDPYSASAVRRLLRLVVEAEAPVHSHLVFRRVVACFGGSKLGRKAQAHLDSIVQRMAGEGHLHVQGEFFWRSREQVQTFTEFRRGGPDGEPRDLEQIAPEELANALAGALSEALSAPEEDLLRETARALGVERVGLRVEAALGSAVALLVARRACVRESGRLRWTPNQPALDGAPPPSVVRQILANSGIGQRLVAVGIESHRLEAALSFLLARSGRSSSADFARALGEPHHFRVRGLVVSLTQVLNVDGYQVLRMPTEETIELNRSLLEQAFGVRC